MKLSQFAVAIGALFAISTTWAGNLTASSNVEILAFDGLRVKMGQTPQINDEKQHQVVIAAGDIVDGNYYATNPIVLSFQGSNENIEIVAPTLRNKAAAEKFKNAPTFEIKTASGKNITFNQDFLKGEGFAPNSRVEENLAKYNAGKGVAAIPAFTNAAIEAKGQMIVSTNNIKEEELQLLFSKADKETQQRFLEWAKKNAK